MQLVGRLCEACGDSIVKLGDGDGCGACDVVVCSKCLEGTSRCPSCQRAFSETRDEAPRAEPRSDAATDRGRRQVMAVAVSLGGAVVLLASIGAAGGQGFVMHAMAIGLLLVQIFRGRGWARWFLVVLTAASGLSNGLQAVQRFGEDGSYVSLGLALVFLWSAGVLALSKPVARFLRAQRLRNP